MAQLMRGESSADPSCDGRAPQLSSSGGGRPLATTRPAVEDTEQRADWKSDTSFEPRLELVPAPRVHAHLAAASALAATHEQRAASVIEIGFSEGQRFLDPQAARQRTTIKPRRRWPCASSPALRMTATISSTLGGSAG
jgi:hypothetical protein